MTQEQRQKQTRQIEDAQEETRPADVTNAELAESTEATLDNIDDVLSEEDDLDSLLDEIDDALEEQAEEFVKNYVQQGGQ